MKKPVSLAAVALIPWAPHADTHGGSQKVLMTLARVLDFKRMTIAMQVAYQLPSQSSSKPLILELDTLEPGLQRIRDQVSDLVVRDAVGTVTMTAQAKGGGGNGATFLRWQAGRATSGTVSVSYTMPVALSKPPKRGPMIKRWGGNGGKAFHYGCITYRKCNSVRAAPSKGGRP